jgi:hypothetical protein
MILFAKLKNKDTFQNKYDLNAIFILKKQLIGNSVKKILYWLELL